MPTPPYRSRDLRSLLRPVTAPMPVVVVDDSPEAKVDAALLAWVNRIVDETQLFARLSRLGVWRVEDTRWDMAVALRAHLHRVLVQLKEAAREHAEEGEHPCGPGVRSVVAQCRDGDLCGWHRAWWGRFADVLVTFREEVTVAVPIRARASVEASEAERAAREVPEKPTKGKR